uniref:Glutamyl-tRNA(Gln) amidotransferase subunit B, mitochondrial n=1 Tax=Palpitomonas bilix TaxID=652834 RepID=A0A7S3CY26_9EUKA|mmetsp:Transcript_11600/g.31137  ORF Transcript_11600/g.31137 Transcript_11600/m.31137 type:complete len:475 (+) Transcript_11600:60-1484(+)
MFRLSIPSLRRSFCSAAAAAEKYEVVVGLEVHAQIGSRSKLFSGSSTQFASAANSQVSIFDAATPGTLPVPNRGCVIAAVKTARALRAQVNKHSVFERKHYFYADLPLGYQITQQQSPIASDGLLSFEIPKAKPNQKGKKHSFSRDQDDDKIASVRIERIQLEQDSGKSIHDLHPSKTLVDLNRAGCALMEIVTGPDMRSSAEAGAFVRSLQNILHFVGTSDADMEKGNLRVDANISIRLPGEGYGQRCEVKNLNSIRFLMKAIDHEVERQAGIIENGGVVLQETRGFDAAKGETYSLRSKESAWDYRFMPDPDLPSLIIDDVFIDSATSDMPELPLEARDRLMNEKGLNKTDASMLVSDPDSLAFFLALSEGRSAQIAANWVSGDVLGRLNASGLDWSTAPVSVEQVGSIIDLIAAKEISGKIGKDVLDVMFEGDARLAGDIAKEKGWKQISDASQLADLARKLVEKHAKEVT